VEESTALSFSPKLTARDERPNVLLETRGLSKNYGAVSPAFGRPQRSSGEIHASWRQRAGKSTLVKVLTGAVTPNARDPCSTAMRSGSLHRPARKGGPRVRLSGSQPRPLLTVAQNLRSPARPCQR